MGMKDLIGELIKGIPNYKSFMTVDELNESSKKLAVEHSDLVSLHEIGRSRNGEAIYALKIGGGERRALLFGFPHPNEPVGSMMLEYLSQALVENEELRQGYAWVIIKCADPDGARLNEGWFKGPFTPLNYALNYYRPAGNQQVEWTFPIEYKTLHFNKPIPETRALMNVIGDERPDFMYSLHNAGFGGVYFYINREAPNLYEEFIGLVKDQGVPLSLGEPEVPYARELSKSVYLMPTTKQTYDYLEKHLDRDPAEVIKTGTSSDDFARMVNPDVFVLVTEVPYYYDPRIENLSESNVQRRRAVLDSVKDSESILNFIDEGYKEVRSELTVKSKFRESIEYFLSVTPAHLEAKRKWALTDPKLERKATVAEEFDNYLVNKFYNMLILGLFYRMLKLELEKGEYSAKINRIKNSVLNKIHEINDFLEENLEYSVIPIRKLVAIQLGAGLLSLLYMLHSR